MFDYLTDAGIGEFHLRYVRNKEKYEIDFLILREKKVFLAIEVKLTDETLNHTWSKFMPGLNCSYGIQLVMKPNIYKIHEFPSYKVLVISAANFLRYLI